jgi:hypothetical protein
MAWGRVEPSDGQGQAGRDERGSQFGGEVAWYGAAGEADRPQLQQSVALDVIPWALVAAERVLGVRGDPVRAGMGMLLATGLLGD